MPDTLAERRKALLEHVAGLRADAFLTLHRPNFLYLTGFTGSNAAVLLSPSRASLLTDGRYREQAAAEAADIEVRIVRNSLLEAAAREAARTRARRVAVEVEHITLSQQAAFRSKLPTGIRLMASTGLVEGLRQRKSPEEEDRIRAAARLASEVFPAMLKLLRPGVQELEIAAEIDYLMRCRGAQGPAFETIVAFGQRSAMPHARPTTRRLRRNELVLLDWGAILRDYCSDITRTLYVGKAPARVRRAHRAVLQAQGRAIEAVRAGTKAGEVDASARRVLRGFGMEGKFTHSLGHGVGLEIHEGPRLARRQKQPLAPGNVVTIEPGAYWPGWGGIRIEDDVLVQEHGCEVITTAPRELLEL